ncbi:unnamed protein product [Symbiodinium sp. CCMP2456]|nr:unnamed protein product [Symbiodinium sp. CCMP2456]
MDRVSLTWINSHLTEKEYIGKFGADSLWRWQANAEVDRLVQNRANERRDLAWEQSILIEDEVVIRVNALLAQRTAAMFQYDQLEGPQVVYPDSKEGNKPPQKKLRRGPKQTKLFKAQRQQKRKTQEAPPGEGKLNKRRQMEAMLGGASPALGHTWVVGHQSRDQLTIKCSTCGLYVQQTESITTFDREVNHHCLFQGLSFAMAAHGAATWRQKTLVKTRAQTKLVRYQLSRPGEVSRNLPIPASVIREKGLGKHKAKPRKGALVEAPPQAETRAAAKSRPEADEYSYYTCEEESAEVQDAGKREKFVAVVRAAAKERQRGSSAEDTAGATSTEQAGGSVAHTEAPVKGPSPGDDQEMVEPSGENLPPVKEDTTEEEVSMALPQEEAKAPTTGDCSSSSDESSSSSSATEGLVKEPEQMAAPGADQEMSRTEDGTLSFAKAKAPPPGITIPGADQEMKQRAEASTKDYMMKAASQVKEELPGETSPEGPVETPKEEDTRRPECTGNGTTT